MDEVIREATINDAISVVTMGRKFLMEGPYKGKLTDVPEYFIKFTMGLIDNPSAKVLVADNHGLLIGVLAFMFGPHYLSGESVASELIWYVEPMYRGQVSLELYYAAVKLAKEMGAKRMHFTAPTDAIGAIYLRLGYNKVETGYQKEL